MLDEDDPKRATAKALFWGSGATAPTEPFVPDPLTARLEETGLSDPLGVGKQLLAGGARQIATSVGGAVGAGRLAAEMLSRTGGLTLHGSIDPRATAESAEAARGQMHAVADPLLEAADRTFGRPKSGLENVADVVGPFPFAGMALRRGIRAIAARTAAQQAAEDLPRIAEAQGIARTTEEKAVQEAVERQAGRMRSYAETDAALTAKPTETSDLLRAHDRKVAEAQADAPRVAAQARETEMFPEVARLVERQGAGQRPPYRRTNPYATLYSGLDPSLLKSRPVAAAGLAATGYGLSESDNPELAATGRGIMALAALHAVGMPRIAAAGRAVGGRVVEGLSGSNTGRRIVEAINPEALLTSEVRSAIGTYERDVARGAARARELGGKARKLGPAGDRAVSDVIEGEHFEAARMTPQETERVMAVASEIAQEFHALGQQKVARGLLPEAATTKYAGRSAALPSRYLPRKYAAFEAEDALTNRPSGTAQRGVRIQGDKRRIDDLAPDIRNMLGEIREASYRTEAGVEKSARDLAAARLFDTLKQSPGAVHPRWAAASDQLQAARVAGDQSAAREAQLVIKRLSSEFAAHRDGPYVALPDSRGLGPLRGAVVRREIANSVNGLPEVGGAGGALLRFWKIAHTVYNPGTHIGNFASNVSLAHLAGLPSWEQPMALRLAAKDLKAYGPGTRALAEAGVLDQNVATVTGEGAATVARTGQTKLRELARTTRPETAARLTAEGVGTMGDTEKAARTFDMRLKRLYNNEDNVFRVALYRKATLPQNRGGLGMTSEQAAEYVRASLINFRTRSPALNWMRKWTSPFVLFPAKALPTVARQIVEHPWRYLTLAATWASLDQYSQHKVGRIEDRDLPERDKRNKAVGYLMPGTIQLPITNAEGEKYAFDVSRFTPMSALTTGGPPGSTGSAVSENLPAIVQPSGPLVDVIARAALNTDPFTGEKFIRPSDTPRDVLQKSTVGQVGPGTFTPGAAAGFGLPSALSYHIPRVASDLANDDTKAAAIDAFGVTGLRPRVIRPGQEAQRQRYRYERELADIQAEMRQSMRKAKSPDARAAVFARAREKRRALLLRRREELIEMAR